MANDINKVILVGRLTRDAEQSYTQGGLALLKFSMAVNRSRKQGENWVEEANFFDLTVFGRQGEAIAGYMTKGKQVAIEGQLRQNRWQAQDGGKRSKVVIDCSNVQLLGGRTGGMSDSGPRADERGWDERAEFEGRNDSYPPLSESQGIPPSSFEDDIPF